MEWDLRITLWRDGRAIFRSNYESNNYDMLQKALKKEHPFLYKKGDFLAYTTMRELTQLSRFFKVRLS